MTVYFLLNHISGIQDQPQSYRREASLFLHVPRSSQKHSPQHFPTGSLPWGGEGEGRKNENKWFHLFPLTTLTAAVMDEERDDEWQTFLLKTPEWKIHQQSWGQSMHKRQGQIRSSSWAVLNPKEFQTQTWLPTTHQGFTDTIRKLSQNIFKDCFSWKGKWPPRASSHEAAVACVSCEWGQPAIISVLRQPQHASRDLQQSWTQITKTKEEVPDAEAKSQRKCDHPRDF